MKRAFPVIVISLLCLSVHAQKKETEDVSILRAGDPAYAEATNLASFVEERGIHIKSVHKSVMQGFFKGVWTAAFYRTDKGAFQVIFFPEPKQAEKITVKEAPEGRRFIYTFEGQPEPNPPRDTMNAGYKMYFIMSDNRMIIVDESVKLYDALKEIFQ